MTTTTHQAQYRWFSMFRGLHNWLIKSCRLFSVFVNSEYCKQQSRFFYLMFSQQLFIFLERSCDCFSVRQSIINKTAWNQCYISLDNGRHDAATWEDHHGKWWWGPGLSTTGGPTASSTWYCHASVNFLIYEMRRKKNCRRHEEYLKTGGWVGGDSYKTDSDLTWPPVRPVPVNCCNALIRSWVIFWVIKHDGGIVSHVM